MAPLRRGPKTNDPDAELLEQIRAALAGSPFHSESHLKIWARLRVQGVCTSTPRVLRLMRENQLLAPQRQVAPVGDELHGSSIVSGEPNPMWDAGATTTVTLADGHVAVFAAVDPCTGACVGIHAVSRATRFEALEPLHQDVREQFGSFGHQVDAALRIRHDHGSQYSSDHFQNELHFPGMESSPAFVCEPEGNGYTERFFRTLKEKLPWVWRFRDLEELQLALREFRGRHNRERLVERLSFQSPRQAPERLQALRQTARLR